MELRSRWTMQVRTVVSGNAAVMATAKALEAIDDGQQDIADAAIFELVHDTEPEFGALILLEP